MAELQTNLPVQIFLGDGQLEIRRLLRAALRDLRLDALQDYETCSRLRDALQEGQPDLIIIDAELEGGDACRLVQAVRHNELGWNPYVTIVVTTWEPSSDRIREIIDSGADGLLLKPVSISKIQEHLDRVVNERRPFVVTSSYIGPDRRQTPRPGGDAYLIEVPNTLRSKVRGEPVDYFTLRSAIVRRNAQINSERLRRNAFEISFLVRRALDRHGADPGGAMLSADLGRLLHVTGDTVKRLRGSEFQASAELCGSLLRMVSGMVEEGGRPVRDDLQILGPLSDAILAGFHPERSQSELMGDIMQAVEAYHERQKIRAG